MTIDAVVDDGVITHAEPILGAMHRGAEKLFESRDYRQILALANRHEWLSSFTGELGVALLLERELGIEAPDLAAWLRTLLAEYHRVTSHLAFLGGYPWHDAAGGQRLRRQRELLVEHLQDFVGSRMHTMVVVVGGLAAAPTDDWLRQCATLTAQVAEVAAGCQAAIDGIDAGLGTLSPADIQRHAVSGPAARASGWHEDVRTPAPGMRYSLLPDTSPVTQSSGDVAARLTQLVAEIRQSASLINDCVANCLGRAGEPTDVLLPKVLRVPDGEYSSRLDTPLGTAYWYLVSTGDKMPHRLGLRPASLHTVLALSTALAGAHLRDAAAIVASMPFVSGDAER